MPSQLRLMAVHAHPDDESSKGAATMARYVSEGAQVLVCTLTGGERGSVLNPAMDRPEVKADMPRVRREEMARAREILGVQQRFLGFVDSGLPEGDPKPPLPEGCFALVPLEEAAAPLVRLIRSFRPHVLTTYDENGGYPHPDHIKCHEISVFAYEAAADPERYPDLGEPWQVSKLYYQGSFTRGRLEAIGAAMEERGLENPYAGWLKDRDPSRYRDDRITTRVECADYFHVRDAALIAHATQIDPDGFFFSVPRELQAEVWPTEDFELVDSKVETTTPEDDLFAGLR